MLYFVQQKRGVRPYWRLNVVLCATFLTMFPGLKPIFAQIVAQNATFPFLWCKEAGKRTAKEYRVVKWTDVLFETVRKGLRIAVKPRK